jgi:hypothetical protein
MRVAYVKILWVFLSLNFWAHAQQCQNFTCDSTVIREVMDSAGVDGRLYFPQAIQVTEGRITAFSNLGFRFRQLIPALCRCSKISVLDLRGAGLSKLPGELPQLRSLKQLDVSDNNFSIFVPSPITWCWSLEYLDISKNQVREISGPIENFHNLQVFDVSNNNLESLGSFQLPSGLRRFNVSHNQISSLPDDLPLYHQLEQLDISYNWIDKIPDSAFSSPSLVSLSATYNRLSVLPEQIGKCISLSSMDLSYNAFKNLTAQIGYCSGIRELNLAENQLEGLPMTITKLKPDLPDTSANYSIPSGDSTIVIDYSVHIDGNRLCNVNDSTRQWLNVYAGEWSYTQHCSSHTRISSDIHRVPAASMTLQRKSSSAYICRYCLPRAGTVTISAYTLNGRLLQVLQSSFQESGSHRLDFMLPIGGTSAFCLRMVSDGAVISQILVATK